MIMIYCAGSGPTGIRRIEDKQKIYSMRKLTRQMIVDTEEMSVITDRLMLFLVIQKAETCMRRVAQGGGE